MEARKVGLKYYTPIRQKQLYKKTNIIEQAEQGYQLWQYSHGSEYGDIEQTLIRWLNPIINTIFANFSVDVFVHEIPGWETLQYIRVSGREVRYNLDTETLDRIRFFEFETRRWEDFSYSLARLLCGRDVESFVLTATSWNQDGITNWGDSTVCNLSGELNQLIAQRELTEEADRDTMHHGRRIPFTVKLLSTEDDDLSPWSTDLDTYRHLDQALLPLHRLHSTKFLWS
jgi:hypothetical protein